MKEVFGKHEEGMKLADLHVHTNVSFDVREGLSPEEVVMLAIETNLNLVAITDHGDISGAERARELVLKKELPVEIVTGIEVSTDKGHIVGLYVREPIEKNVSLEQAIYQIHRQGGLVIIPHPFLRRPIGIQEDALLSIIEDSSRELVIDGFEVYSQGVGDVLSRRRGRSIDSNSKALEFYLKHSEKLGAAISSSDAHRMTIGRARTAYHGNLSKAIEEKKTIPMYLDWSEQYAIVEVATASFGEDRVKPKGIR